MATQRNFSFGKMKRSFYTTTLKDGKVLVVNMPRKRTFEKMTELQEMDKGETTNDMAFNSIASLVAEILSNNKTDTKIEADYVTENFDLEEMIEYIKDYMEFTKALNSDPN